MTDHPAISENPPPLWLRALAVLTVCATVVLLFLGAKVTTLQVGMADPGWPTQPLHLFFADREDAGYLIEHSHRFAGWVVGFLSVALTVAVWLTDRRRWVCWTTTIAMCCIGIQGLLGGLRVLENVRHGLVFATIHGCFAMIVFALLASVALFLSRGWSAASAEHPESPATAVRRVGLLACVLVYGQIVLGAILRHSQLRIAQRLHLLFAFVAFAGLIWLIARVRSDAAGDRRLRRFAWVLAVLTAVQIVLGVEAWMSRAVEFALGAPLSMSRVALTTGLVRSLHQTFGALVFAFTVLVTLQAYRRAGGVISLNHEEKMQVDATRSPEAVVEGAP